MKYDEIKKMNQDIAKENFLIWNQALENKDLKKIAQLYAPNATLLATVSPKLRKGKKEIREYFEEFLKLNPKGYITEEKVEEISKEIYLHLGLYYFKIEKDSQYQIVKARFTYIWKKRENQWLIIHHHSSQQPE